MNRFWFDIGQFLILIGIGYFFGRAAEFRHYKSIRRREQASKRMAVLVDDTIDPSWKVAKATLVSGTCVVAVDYFKLVAASLRNLFGGRVSAYESLLDRARREAILRMKEQARQEGCSVVIGTHIDTSSISGAKPSRGTIISIELMVSGTALKLS